MPSNTGLLPMPNICFLYWTVRSKLGGTGVLMQRFRPGAQMGTGRTFVL